MTASPDRLAAALADRYRLERELDAVLGADRFVVEIERGAVNRRRGPGTTRSAWAAGRRRDAPARPHALAARGSWSYLVPIRL